MVRSKRQTSGSLALSASRPPGSFVGPLVGQRWVFFLILFPIPHLAPSPPRGQGILTDPGSGFQVYVGVESQPLAKGPDL